MGTKAWALGAVIGLAIAGCAQDDAPLQTTRDGGVEDEEDGGPSAGEDAAVDDASRPIDAGPPRTTDAGWNVPLPDGGIPTPPIDGGTPERDAGTTATMRDAGTTTMPRDAGTTTMPRDAGTTTMPRDAGTTTMPRDAGTTTMPRDAGTTMARDAGTTARDAGAPRIDAGAMSSCDADGDGHRSIACGGRDCDDLRAATHPGATEVCNGIDDDCMSGPDGEAAIDWCRAQPGYRDGTYVVCRGATGTCEETGCDTRRADCDGVAANGCEVNTTTSREHCGTCGHECEWICGPDCPLPDQLALGVAHTCTTVEHRVWCWGANDHGQLGDGTRTDRLRAVEVSGIPAGTWLRGFVAGLQHTCALTSGGEVWCWGSNSHGELGDGTTIERTRPVRVVGLPASIFRIAAGGHTTCAIATDRQLWCWGENADGQVGDGTTTDRARPVAIATGLRWATVGIGGHHACARIHEGADTYCWGRNSSGQLGDGTRTSRSTPTRILDSLDLEYEVALGANHTCSLSADDARCFGDDSFGQLGPSVGADGSAFVPAFEATNGNVICSHPVDGAPPRVSNRTQCSGERYGRTPRIIEGLGAAWQIVLGIEHGCSTRSTTFVEDRGVPLCFGENGRGQLGDGTTTDTGAPPRDVVAVLPPL